ncbi:pyridoxamine 5'-phosphate oxidase family protein [Algoriphagus halophytocola]|uniref:Pyridoxamine 5'-phosphate oxidase family protein n=1 Tax=Algoriphagus halophytocola TaxID=2991499 RepID=A0ABY6MKX3_9BACT|nr:MULTISPECIES: pyridoxamine 5'-phosphate oxidase family protein [unclassified Algoriphagus]UZD24425.1 pyridoxamine 5'-phosphate oxidase family protein [Algoriphagus sp. TR-M5]WBL41789.1 pyridoxamine 5'-phosphate oxidase family protein [Algoriphagus sp. TR-M9]
MNSINENQEEHNREDLMGSEAVEKIRGLIDKSGSCFFVTSTSLNNSHKSRPMSVQKTDDAGNIWFLSAKDSMKNMEIAADTDVTLYFQGSSYSDFLELNGHAVISDDRAKIEELWDPTVKAWFTEGKDDPRISVIQFIPDSGYYWDNKHGNAVAGIKVLISAISGKTMDDSIEGTLKV